MLSQPATKIIMKTGEPKAAKWASELIGEVEIERVRETVADGKRAGTSFTMDRQIEPLVMASEIEGLPDLHAFLKLGNYVTRFSFPHIAWPKIAPAQVRRNVPDQESWINPVPPAPTTDRTSPAPNRTTQDGTTEQGEDVSSDSSRGREASPVLTMGTTAALTTRVATAPIPRPTIVNPRVL